MSSTGDHGRPEAGTWTPRRPHAGRLVSGRPLTPAVAPVTWLQFVRRKVVLVLIAQAAASAMAWAEPVRPGDILEITVAARPDLARLRTVQTTGVIWMPRLSEVVVAGLTPDEIGSRLTALLARYEPMRPTVTVQIARDLDPFVRVLGAVNKPGRHELKGRMRLFDVLLAAGGFTARASGEVRVERREGTFRDGTSVRRFRLPRGSPTPDALAELEAILNGGDIVTAAVEEAFPDDSVVVEPRHL
jgi:protein involved in polysaccharide export with SLBB domain